MVYDQFIVEKSQDIRLQPSFWGKLARFSTMISREECPFSSLAPSRALLNVYWGGAENPCPLKDLSYHQDTTFLLHSQATFYMQYIFFKNTNKMQNLAYLSLSRMFFPKHILNELKPN